MQVLKAIFIFLLTIYFLWRWTDSIDIEKQKDKVDRAMTLYEMAISIILIFLIYKI